MDVKPKETWLDKLIVSVLTIIVAAAISSAIGAFLAIFAAWIWNTIVPPLFHLPQITWLQMWLLIILLNLLIPHSASSASAK